MNEKPDCLELDRLLICAEKAAGKERAAKFREAADEARAWADYHNRRSVETLTYGSDFDEGYY
jgi:hypothetical protein